MVEARSLSRTAGIARARAELTSLGISARTTALADELGRDAIRARAYARSYASRWLKATEGQATRDAARAASGATVGSVQRTATTESADAFGTGRAKYIRVVPDVQLLKVWDAELDKQTCPVCSGADGTIVGTREAFPAGEPGSIHPYCRCSFTILSFAEVRDGSSLIEAVTKQ